MTVIGLSGYAGAGKDTVGEILATYHGFRRVAFAARLKALAARLDPVLSLTPPLTALMGGDVEDAVVPTARYSEVLASYGGDLDVAKREIPAVREFLQVLGVSVREEIGPDVWVDAALAGTAGQDIAVTDCRFPNEAAAIRRCRGVVLRVERPGCAPVNAHVSESALDGYAFDAVIDNSGSLADLEVEVARTLGYLGIR